MRTCYNAANAATERSSRTSRYIPASQLAQAIGASERVVARTRDRLTSDGLLVLDADDATPALRSCRLAS